MGDRNVDYTVLERILAGTERPRHLPLEILTSITDNFSEDRKIGRGGFSDVYKGVLHHWSVAVKRVRVDIHTMDEKLFLREVRSLLKIIEHPNVVRFLGFCSNTHHEVKENKGAEKRRIVEISERLLCFEYISNRSLEKYITDELRGLEWNIRYQIIKGICQGLQYLHNEMDIVHMDLKPSNIMMVIVDTDTMVPKITDFGLARLVENKYTTGVRFISRGYSAPEYMKIGETTLACDIYSLGVIIKEIITGRNYEKTNKEHVIRRWRCRWRKSPTYTPLYFQQIIKCIEVAERCMQEESGKRPSISHIIRDLNESENTDVYIPAVNQVPYLDNDDMLGIEPLELRFAFEFNNEIVSNEVELTNETDNCIAFNIKTVSQLEYLYCTQPNNGIVPPKSNIKVKITLRAQEMTQGRPMPRDDEFIVQSTMVQQGLTDEDITEDMFNEEAGKVVDVVQLTVVYDDVSVKPQADQSSLEPNGQVNEETKLQEQGHMWKHLNFSPVLQILPASTKLKSPKALEVGTVTALTGAMGSLRSKLLELLKEEHNLDTSVKKDVKSLERQVIYMHDDLYKLSQAQRDQLEDKDMEWAKDMRDLSYDIEDKVNDLMVQINRSKSFTSSQGFLEGIKCIKDRVKEVSQWHDKYKVPDFLVTPVISSTVESHLQALYGDHTKLVGIDGPRDELVKKLTGWGDETNRLKIISIFGEGGLGKTTLAKSVFDRLTEKFLLKAFVSVGRSPDAKKLLKNILDELENNAYPKCFNQLNAHISRDDWNEQLLIDKLRNALRSKRYLIIIDDIWDIELWDTIKFAFIDDGNGSRVITTSRILKVANHSGEVCKLEPLTYHDSKELFYATLTFCSKKHATTLTNKGIWTSRQPDEATHQYILEKCDGLPLAIITIATLLYDKPEEEWLKVYNSIGFGLEGTRSENAKKILLFSYNQLPCHLKTCLLYLSIFPEDQVIDKNMLVWKWIAEGFVHEDKSETLFKVGERYFYELVSRSIIQPIQHPVFFTISGCRVHDMVRDLVCTISKEENFVSILDSGGQTRSTENDDARIVTVQNRVLVQGDLGNTPKHMVIRSFNATRSDLSQMELDLMLPRFKVLHVLSLEDSKIYGAGQRDAGGVACGPAFGFNIFRFRYVCCLRGEHKKLAMHEGLPASPLEPVAEEDQVCCLKNLVRFHHLRYLGLSGSDIGKLPEEIGDLFRSLLILDLRHTEIEELPKSVTLLRKLKCLLCGIILKLPVGMGSLTSLEELELHLVLDDIMYSLPQYMAIGNFVHELSKLKELRVLRIRLKNELSPTFTKALVQSLNYLTKLEELEIYDPTGGWNHPSIWGDYSPRIPLSHVRLCNSEPPAWIINATLRNVTFLHLEVSSLKVGYIDKLQCLAELRSLFLFIPFHVGINFEDVITAAFPKLRYFKTNCWLKYRQGAMKCLESLQLVVQVRANVSFDFDSLKYLPLLQKVTAVIENMGAKKEKSGAVKAAVRHALDNHPNRPILDLEATNWCTDDKNNPGSYDDDGREIEKDSDGEQTDDELRFWVGCCDGIYRK